MGLIGVIRVSEMSQWALSIDGIFFSSKNYTSGRLLFLFLTNSSFLLFSASTGPGLLLNCPKSTFKFCFTLPSTLHLCRKTACGSHFFQFSAHMPDLRKLLRYGNCAGIPPSRSASLPSDNVAPFQKTRLFPKTPDPHTRSPSPL